MQIFWHGFSSVRIESQHGDQQATLITDPFEAELGLKFPRSLSPSVVALSHQQRERFPLNVFENKPFVMADPGEFEVDGVFAYVIPLADEQHPYPHTLMYRFEIEGMSVGFLGGADRSLTDAELGKLEDIDILLLPVGGDDRLSAKQAIETISAIEPRVVIPLYHHIEGVKKILGTADAFCKELGVCQRQDANRLKIARKDLPSEDLLVAVLEKV